MTSSARAECKSAVDELKRVTEYEEDYLVFLKKTPRMTSGE